ncbi:hypothetical protein RIF29_15426 [Crotalaria pallida]|uniref:Uncharacterized protein n=1 Tax=Crotalaria pallida TaxID=3830 RepID=A0AAN9FFK4_CROPI
MLTLSPPHLADWYRRRHRVTQLGHMAPTALTARNSYVGVPCCDSAGAGGYVDVPVTLNIDFKKVVCAQLEKI